MSVLKEYPQLKILQDLAKRKKIAVYLVGGYLRDALLGMPKNDFDFAVQKNALDLARQFADAIKGAYVLLDEEQGCARVVKKIKGDLITFDFADYRAEDIKKDLLHRDFTINTLCVDLLALDDESDFLQKIEDHKNGKRDLNQKTVRMTSVKVFKEDPLRLLRAFSLQAILGFKIDEKTLQSIKNESDLIRQTSDERIREELFKILASPRAYANIKQMDKIGLLDRIIPQITVMYNCEQGGYHHLDVWRHSLETLHQFELIWKSKPFGENQGDIEHYFFQFLGGQRTRLALTKLGCLLHDIGKPESKRKAEGRLIFHSHEHIAQRIVKIIAKKLKLSTRERHILEDLARWHLRPGYLSNFKRPSEKAIYRFFRDLKTEAVSVLVLSLADQKATRGPLTSTQKQDHHRAICLEMIHRYFEKQKEQPVIRLIDGHDLIKGLKMKPSPLFAKILSAVEEQQNLGKIKTKAEALEIARQIVAKDKE